VYEKIIRPARVAAEESAVHSYEKTTRTRAIHLIERCYPPDSKTPTNARIGQHLLQCAWPR
jgi:hypothetical protein